MKNKPWVRWLIGKLFKLPAATQRDIKCDENLTIPMRDGVRLLANHLYFGAQPNGPTVLIRSSYGREALFGLMAQMMCERGFQVLVQSVRGTCGSEGELDPMRQEANDGADTIAWIEQQPWFNGQLFTFGISYLGNTAIAAACAAPGNIQGVGVAMTLSNFRDELLRNGGFTTEGILGWTNIMRELAGAAPDRSMGRPDPSAIAPALTHLPLNQADQKAFGQSIPWWQTWLQHEQPEDPWWQPMNHTQSFAALDTPVHMVTGWQDIFLPSQMQDFCNRQQAGKPTHITIGPWNHVSMGGMLQGLNESIRFFLRTTSGQSSTEAPVKVYLQQAKRWLEFPSWPPPQAQPLTLYLRSDVHGEYLSPNQPNRPELSQRYTYDPANPTPSLHGPSTNRAAKLRDMSSLRDRSDTVMFTGDVLSADTDIAGPVSVNLSVRSNRQHTDFFVCLCDIDSKGRPLQVSDGYLRLRPNQPAADIEGTYHIEIECWPTAYRFKRGHRIGLIIASGAHPRYQRNLGTGEPIDNATDMMTAAQELMLGERYQPRIKLMQI